MSRILYKVKSRFQKKGKATKSVNERYAMVHSAKDNKKNRCRTSKGRDDGPYAGSRPSRQQKRRACSEKKAAKTGVKTCGQKPGETASSLSPLRREALTWIALVAPIPTLLSKNGREKDLT